MQTRSIPNLLDLTKLVHATRQNLLGLGGDLVTGGVRSLLMNCQSIKLGLVFVSNFQGVIVLSVCKFENPFIALSFSTILLVLFSFSSNTFFFSQVNNKISFSFLVYVLVGPKGNTCRGSALFQVGGAHAEKEIPVQW